MEKRGNQKIKNELLGIKNKKGITLIALIITIIVLLILAGVSLNAIVGDNGIITNAMKAKELAEESERKETLDFIINEYNSDVATDTSDNSFTNFLAKMKEKGKIEDFIFYGENLIIKYGGYYYEVVEEDDYYKISKKMTEDLESTGGATKVVTPDNIKNAENGNVSFEDGDEFIILDNVTVDNFNFIIPAKATVTIKLLGDMKIDNKNTSNKSAIDLGVEKEKDGNGIWQYKNGATLNLYVYGKVEVNSSFGEKGEDSQSASTSAAKGGPRSKSRNKSTKNSNFKLIWDRRINSNRRGCWKWRKYSKWCKRRSRTVGRSRSSESVGNGRRRWKWKSI